MADGEPFQAEGSLSLAPTSAFASGDFFTVPAGKRLEVRFVSGAIELPSGIVIQHARLRVAGGGQIVSHVFDVVLNNVVALISQPLLLHAQPGSKLGASITTNKPEVGGPTRMFNLTVSGYLFPA